MTPRQLATLGWVLAEAIDISNERRPDLEAGEAVEEYEDLACLIDLVAAQHELLGRRLLDRLKPPLGAEQPGQLVNRDCPDLVITGTLERLAGQALLGPVKLDDAGRVDFDYAGDTTVWWDEQRTEHTSCGQIIFIDAKGDEVRQDQVALRLPDGRLVHPLTFAGTEQHAR